MIKKKILKRVLGIVAACVCLMLFLHFGLQANLGEQLKQLHG